MTGSSDKPLVSIYTFNFVVRAQTQKEADKILKDELGITKSHNSSHRQINGLYLVACAINAKDITKDFYKKISDSDKIAIHSDGKSTSLYPEILKEIQNVEIHLRWLLLHVSDAVEDYVKLFDVKSDDITTRKGLDPITALLTLNKTLEILETDSSWLNTGVTDERLRSLMESSDTFDSFKKSYLEKTNKKIIWELISEIVLQKPVDWDNIGPKLKTLKEIRNKCAHFRTVTDVDLSKAKRLSADVLSLIKVKQRISTSTSRDILNLSRQLSETLQTIQKSYYKDIIKLTDASLSAQQVLAQLSNSTSPSLSDTAKSMTEMINKIYGTTLNNDIHRLTSSLGKLNIPEDSEEKTEETQTDSDGDKPPVDNDSSKKKGKKK